MKREKCEGGGRLRERERQTVRDIVGREGEREREREINRDGERET